MKPVNIELTAADIVTAKQPTASDLNMQAVGNVADSAADSGNPLKIGARVVNSGFPSSIGHNSRADLRTDSAGRLLIRILNGDEFTFFNSVTLTTTAETTLLAAAASTNKALLYVFASNGGAVADTLTFKDSTGGTTRFILDVPAISGGPVSFGPFPVPIYQASANQNWTVTATTGTGPIHVFALATRI